MYREEEATSLEKFVKLYTSMSTTTLKKKVPNILFDMFLVSLKLSKHNSVSGRIQIRKKVAEEDGEEV